MKLTRTTWIAFFFVSLLSLAAWLKFSYPQLIISPFSVDRQEAFRIAEAYLRNERHIPTENFRHAAIFSFDRNANRYLQKSIGFAGLKNFIQQYDFDLFFWMVRFFQENRKEEYILEISSATGEIIGFNHMIDDAAPRKAITNAEALARAKAFVRTQFGFEADDRFIRSNLATHRDNRSDFTFSWQKNNPGIPWSDRPDSGTGKLLINAKISGDEILSFSKGSFLVPEQFSRYLDARNEFSQNTSVILKILILALFISGIFFILARQNHLAMQTTKKFYIGIMAISFFLSLLAGINQFENILFSYATTLSFSAYLWRSCADSIIGALFITVTLLIPSLSGELLHYETSPEGKTGSFLHYVRSTFASRNVFQMIALGYFICAILLGMQSVLVKIGQTYLGVWIEYKWIDNVSAAYLPFLAALTIGYKASFSEEIMYRLYAISLGKKMFARIFPKGKGGPLLLAVVLSSLIWGFSHSGYPIFPGWFRGLEVTCIGLFLSFIYLKFGILPVIVSHYLFDVFWNSAGYLFGKSQPFYFYSAVAVLLLPFALGLIAFFINRKEEERPLRWQMNKHQRFNVEVLRDFLRTNQKKWAHKTPDQIKQEITAHGWDPAVVETAIEDFEVKNASNSDT